MQHCNFLRWNWIWFSISNKKDFDIRKHVWVVNKRYEKWEEYFHGMKIILIVTEKRRETKGEISNKEVFSFLVAKQRSLWSSASSTSVLTERTIAQSLGPREAFEMHSVDPLWQDHLECFSSRPITTSAASSSQIIESQYMEQLRFDRINGIKRSNLRII